MTENGVMEKKGLDRNVIKCIAMLTMFLNHFAHVLLEEGPLYYAFTYVGYFTAITMCYFLVEGYEYTRSKKKYAMRLLVFALISEIPFVLATGYPALNMLFTLLICFTMLWLLENMKNEVGKILLIILLFFVSAFADWPLMAPAFTLLFRWSKKDRKKTMIAYGLSLLIYIMMMLPTCLVEFSGAEIVLHLILNCLGIVASAIVILFFYNGKKSNVAPKFFKWFFYVFYPAHLLLLYVVKLLLV